MNDEQYFLANALLDGELTAEERQIAEADPEVMAEVETLRALQTELRDVPAPTALARESAISAALAEFSVADTGRAGAVMPLRPRPASAKYLSVAAAVVAVAGLGILVSQAIRGADDAGFSDAAVPAAESDNPFTESVDTAREGVAADDDGGGDEAGAEDAASDMAATAEATAEEAPQGVADEPVVEAEIAANDSDTAGGADDGQDNPSATAAAQWYAVPPDFDVDAPITDEVELGVFGVYLLQERDAGTLESTPNTRCEGDDEILDTATLDLDGEVTPVYISVIEPDGLVFARVTATCDLVLFGSLFDN